MIRFEVTNGSSEFACRVKGKVVRFEAGEHEIAKPAAELVEKLSCAHFAGVGVVVHEGLDASAVEPDAESLKLVKAYEREQHKRIAALHLELRTAARAGDEELERALTEELGQVRLVPQVEVG